MKKIDEKTLLLALGGVGDDLLLRAEREEKPRRAIAHFGALAACFCLIAVLAVPHVMDGFRMGSDANSAPPPENSNGAMMDDGDAAEPGSGSAAQDKGGAVADAEGVLLRSGAAQLRLWGVFGAEDLAAVSARVRGETENDSSTSVEEKQGELAGLYEMLCHAETMDGEDVAFSQSVEISITLTSGTVLEGEYEEERGILKLEGTAFLNVDLSPWI